MKSIWFQEKIVGGEFLGEKYMAAKKNMWVESFWVKSIWLQEKIVGGEFREFLGEKYMVSRKNCGWRVSG